MIPRSPKDVNYAENDADEIGHPQMTIRHMIILSRYPEILHICFFCFLDNFEMDLNMNSMGFYVILNVGINMTTTVVI